jgi:hypothetical protein
MKYIIKESGIRDINQIKKRYPKAKIYFHQDLDGVTTALGMKHYLEQNGIKVVDAETIQYGDKEFAIKKTDAGGDIMPVLVDFAHGKPMFVIHTDHHDSQAGVEPGTATNFRPSRSNVETISQVVSPKEIFPFDDITLISTVDSANFLAHNITQEMVMNYLFKFDKDNSLKSNKMLMGLVTNKLLLALKNKPRFLENIVLEAKPSLLSILNNIRDQVKKYGYASEVEMVKNQEEYVERMKTSENVKFVGPIIVQYGGGNMRNPGSYDRYTPFRNNPDKDFIVLAWGMGLVQASCNPFKGDRALKGVDLGEMKNEVLSKFEPLLKGMTITFGTLKRVSEIKAEQDSVGFTYKDLIAIYGNRPSFKVQGGEKTVDIIKNISETLYKRLSTKQKEMLDRISVNGWDVVMANSGGHKCITNISGLSYLFRDSKKDETSTYDNSKLQAISDYTGNNTFVNDIKGKLKKYNFLTDPQINAAIRQIEKEGGIQPKEDENKISSYVDLTKAIQDEFVSVLNQKIQGQTNLTESKSNNKKYFVDESKIKGAGKGVFAKTDIKKGETIGLLHTIKKLGSEYDFTELGKMHNHNDKPTCHNKKVGNKRYLVASKNLKKGDELTTDYTLQPDLEQPQKNWGTIKENKEMRPEIDGYRTYSPFKNLEYIIVNGDGIDCNNIVYDLVLIGNNGKVKFCKKNSGTYFLKGATKIVEIPFKNNEKYSDVFKSSETFNEWLKEKIKEIDVKKEILNGFLIKH